MRETLGMKCSYGQWGVRQRVSEGSVGPELKVGDAVVSGGNLLNPFPWTLTLPPLWTQASSCRRGRGSTGSVCAFCGCAARRSADFVMRCGPRGIPQRKGLTDTVDAATASEQTTFSSPHLVQEGWGEGMLPLPHPLSVTHVFVSHRDQVFSRRAALFCFFCILLGCTYRFSTGGQIKLCSQALDSLCVPPPRCLFAIEGMARIM